MDYANFDADDAERFIASQSWTFAKTMPTNPHEYVVKGRGNDPRLFEAFCHFILRTGERRVWGRGRYRKVYVYHRAKDGKLYWTMGWPFDESTILNRVYPENDTSVPFDQDRHFGFRYSGPDGTDPRTDPRLGVTRQ